MRRTRWENSRAIDGILTTVRALWPLAAIPLLTLGACGGDRAHRERPGRAGRAVRALDALRPAAPGHEPADGRAGPGGRAPGPQLVRKGRLGRAVPAQKGPPPP